MAEIYDFTLILSGVQDLTSELADALYESTGGDIELSLREGIAQVDFSRAGDSLRQAVTSAIKQVEQAATGVRVVRVETETANAIAKINADLLGAGSG